MGQACERCGGHRTVRVKGRPAGERVPCPACGGTGMRGAVPVRAHKVRPATCDRCGSYLCEACRGGIRRWGRGWRHTNVRRWCWPLPKLDLSA